MANATKIKKLRRPFIAVLLIVLIINILGLTVFKIARAETAPQLITTRDGLLAAINNAMPGDTVLVGDIDFNFPATSYKEFQRITLNKTITVKSGKTDGRAKLTGGSFIVDGPKQPLDGQIFCRFEGLVFDGEVDGSKLMPADWEDAPANHYNSDPLAAQYAVTFRGNADAFFSNCEFKRYMYKEGGALWCKYGMTGNSLSDYTGCKLSITLENCDFMQNSAFYLGGAIYLYGSRNVSFSAINCNFSENSSSAEGSGGGAIYAQGVKMSLTGCTFTKNTGNRLYGKRPLYDFSEGGALFCNISELTMIDCIITDNSSCNGGGISLHDTKAEIDGCVIAGNKAFTQAEDSANSSMGFGGGVFINTMSPNPVSFVNTSIYQNEALSAYGGVYYYFEEWYKPEYDYGAVDFIFCYYSSNSYLSEYDWNDDEAYGLPLNIWDIDFISAFGSVVIDSDFETVFPSYQNPDAENGYNYFAPPGQAAADRVIPDGGTLTDAGTYRHLNLVKSNNEFIIPDSVVKTVLGGRFANCVGTLRSGDNYNTVTIRLNAGKGKADAFELSFAYGQNVVLPEPTRRGYSFLGWHNADGAPFNTENLYFGTDVDTLTVYSKWERINKPFPAWAIILIVAGGVLMLAAAFIVFLHRRKFAFANFHAPVDSEPAVQIFKNDFSKEFGLTPREQEVIGLLLKGKSQSEIAKELVISGETVKTHIKNIYAKAEVKSRLELFDKCRNS